MECQSNIFPYDTETAIQLGFYTIESSATTQGDLSNDQVTSALLIAHVRPFCLVTQTPSYTDSSRYLRASSLMGVYLGISLALTYPVTSGGTFLTHTQLSLAFPRHFTSLIFTIFEYPRPRYRFVGGNSGRAAEVLWHTLLAQSIGSSTRSASDTSVEE